VHAIIVMPVDMADPDGARSILRILEGHDWIRREDSKLGPQGGNPGERWRVNPHFLAAKLEKHCQFGIDKTDRT
jgi:hypothetical protein